MLRFFLLNGFIVLHTILCCIWSVFLSPFDTKGGLIHRYAGIPWARIILWICGVKVIVKGRERIDPSRARIYMSNHQSYFDIMALLAHLPVNFKFIMKQELMRIPLFGFVVKRARYIGIERSHPKKALKSMNEAAGKIRGGDSVLIFPEGTRSIDGSLQHFKKGGFNLAFRSGCEIVPIAISGSYRIAPKGSLKINRGTFHIHFGEPISTADFNKRDLNALMDRVREAMINQME